MDYVIEKVDAEFDADAKKNGPEAVGYRITWERPSSEYPDAFYATLIITKVKRLVYEWADANMPQAFWKPMFSPTFNPAQPADAEECKL